MPTSRDFEEALAYRQIQVFFQPQTRFSDGAWIGVETLARWAHPKHGLLTPGVFIELAEQPEFALRFTQDVLRMALANARQLQREVGFDGTVSVNLPPSAMSDVSLTERLIDQIDSDGFEHSKVILELTESSIPQDMGVVLDIATRLRMRGIGLSIDDFGVGWSTFERLGNAPFDELKIDMSFVRDAQRDRSARAIVENATRLGHDLRMKVVAEGVEDAGSFSLLRALNCDIAQGYLIAPPMSTAALTTWARGRRAPNSADGTSARLARDEKA